MKNPILKSLVAVALLSVTACGQRESSEKESSPATEAGTAISRQPVESGEYIADSYDITGKNKRSGKFDGRVLVSLSPEKSALYIYENGNRAKIDYKVVLKTPFEKGDCIYTATDSKGNAVTLRTDSTVYTLAFDKNDTHVSINFDSNPKYTGSPVEMLERMTKIIGK